MTRRRSKVPASAAHDPPKDSPGADRPPKMGALASGEGGKHPRPPSNEDPQARGGGNSMCGEGESSPSFSPPSTPASSGPAPICGDPLQGSPSLPAKRSCARCTAVIAGKVFRCSRCRLVFYCGKDCQARGTFELGLARIALALLYRASSFLSPSLRRTGFPLPLNFTRLFVRLPPIFLPYFSRPFSRPFSPSLPLRLPTGSPPTMPCALLPQRTLRRSPLLASPSPFDRRPANPSPSPRPRPRPTALAGTPSVTPPATSTTPGGTPSPSPPWAGWSPRSSP